MIAWVTPDGTPRRMILKPCCLVSLKYGILKSNKSFIRINFSRQSTAEIACAITVASATPLTPILNRITKTRSRIMFSTLDTIRYHSAEIESPRPLNIPLKIL